MAITCVIRYQIDPYQREAFKKYAENWDASFPGAAVTLSGISCHMKVRMTLPGV